MRRLLLLTSAVVAADTVFFAVLTPLLPHFAHRYGLSKAGAGALVAGYAGGAFVGALPAGLAAARFGPKRAVLVGLSVTAAASLGFALATNAWSLGLARVLQGIGSAFSWAGALAWIIGSAPRERRGELIGATMGAAVFGALLGPVLGATASVVGIRSAFVTVAGLELALVAWAATMTAAPTEPQPLRDAVAAARNRRLLGGFWLILLPALLFGVLMVLVPLRLGDFGWGAVAIGSLFVGVTALEMVMHPLLGRFADRRGRLLPVRMALAASIVVSLLLAWAGHPAVIVPLVLAGGLAYGAFFTPGMAVISDAADEAGVAQAIAFGLVNASWAVGAIAGPSAGGFLADVAGDAVPYLIMAAVCATTLAFLVPRRSAASQAAPAPDA